MTMLATAFHVLVGLLVDDGWLALAIIAIVLLSWIFATVMPTCRSPPASCFWSVPLACFSQCRESAKR